MRLSYFLSVIWCFIALSSCGEVPSSETLQLNADDQAHYAKGFYLMDRDSIQILELRDPQNGSTLHRIALVSKNTKELHAEGFDQIIEVPIETIVATSTTHIPALEMLGKTDALVGFPNLDYISSLATRGRINDGLVQELGQNESLNIELLIQRRPDLLMTFAIDQTQNGLDKVSDAGIPIIYNGDWTEQHPLGKAEWIKVFGALFNQKHKADSIFQQIESEYVKLKDLAVGAKTQPKVISGALYKDVWYAPKGNSWAAKFIEDANGDYIWKSTQGTGSLQWNIEQILSLAQTAKFWIGPGQFTSYNQMTQSSPVYAEFPPFKRKEIYTFSKTKGPTGGLLYYELAAMRPDWVLSDLISILHPELMEQGYETNFFKPLDP